jgi:hypothetical protein
LAGEGIKESNHAGSGPVGARGVAYPYEKFNSGTGRPGARVRSRRYWGGAALAGILGGRDGFGMV